MNNRVIKVGQKKGWNGKEGDHLEEICQKGNWRERGKSPKSDKMGENKERWAGHQHSSKESER